MRLPVATLCSLLAACSGSSSVPGAGGAAGQDAGAGLDASDASKDVTSLPESGGADAGDEIGDVSQEPAVLPDAKDTQDDGHDGTESGDASDAAEPSGDTLPSNRDRLLGTYFDFLEANPSATQSNGLSGSKLTSVCDLWTSLDPSSQAVFLTLTARMQGSILGIDDSSMLLHVTKLYRVAGGQGATASDPGSCGGGEFNRMILSMDAVLQGSLLAAHDHAGAIGSNGKRDIADIPATGFWRNSHDLAGPHAPFDRSDETETGEPRGQTQYFKDPDSTLANAALGRMDLAALVDAYALEMDLDYDCLHSSNPLCSYVLYGPTCLPQPGAIGTSIYAQSYGAFEAGWEPVGCGD